MDIKSNYSSHKTFIDFDKLQLKTNQTKNLKNDEKHIAPF